MLTQKTKKGRKKILKDTNGIGKKKIINAEKYAGKIIWDSDALVYQKKIRDEWE